MIKYYCEKCGGEIPSSEVYRVQVSNSDQTSKAIYHFHLDCMPSILSKKEAQAPTPDLAPTPDSLPTPAAVPEVAPNRVLPASSEIEPVSKSKNALPAIEQARVLAACYITNGSAPQAAVLCKRSVSTCRSYAKHMASDIAERWANADHEYYNGTPARTLVNLFANGWPVEKVAEEGQISEEKVIEMVSYYSGVPVADAE